jgi:hypothetical protein
LFLNIEFYLFQDKNFAKYSENEKLMHEAGYDAYATGVAFVAIMYF